MRTTARRASAWATLLMLVATLTLVPATPASALPLIGGCKETPTATVPSASGPAWFGAHASQEPTGEDPFAAGSKTSVYQEYGWPTTWWPTYDLGCGPDIARNPGAVIGSFFAELGAVFTLTYATAFDSLVHAVLDWKGLSAVDGALAGVVDDLRADVWAPLITLIILLTALWFIIKAMRGETGAAIKAAGVTLVGSLALVVVINYPEKSAQMFDSTVKGTVAVAYSGTIPDADSSAEIADGIVSRVHRATMYDRWCEGMVGGGTDAAAKWCPPLWKSLYLSRTEAKLTGAARANLMEAKSDAFEELAEQIKDQDPAAYSTLTGRDFQTRGFSAVAAHVVWPLVSIYPLMSLFLLLVALMLLRVAVMLAPIVGPLLIHPAARRVARAGLHVLGATLINAILFGVASALFLRIETAVMASTDMPIAVRLVAMAVLMVAFLVITKPLLRLKRLKPRKAGTSDEGGKKSRTMKLVTTVASSSNGRQQTAPAAPLAPPPPAEAGIGRHR